jgi:hypothetical protein
MLVLKPVSRKTAGIYIRLRKIWKANAGSYEDTCIEKEKDSITNTHKDRQRERERERKRLTCEPSVKSVRAHPCDFILAAAASSEDFKTSLDLASILMPHRASASCSRKYRIHQFLLKKIWCS